MRIKTIGTGLLIFLLLGPLLAAALAPVKYEGELPAKAPVAIAFDDQGRIYIAQENGIITLKTLKGQTVQTIGGPSQEGEDLLAAPSALCFYQQKLYVTDSKLNRICVFSAEGELLEFFGEKGSGRGQLKNPADIFVYQGILYVADTGNDRIQVFGENGVFLNEIGIFEDAEKSLQDPRQVAVDTRGRVYVADRDKTVQIYSPQGEFLQSTPTALRADVLGLDETGLLTANNETFSIQKHTYDAFSQTLALGSAGEGRAQFRHISDLAVGPRGQILVADDKRNLIQIFLPAHNPDSAPPYACPVAPVTTARWTAMLNTTQDRYLSSLRAAGDRLYAVDQENEVICVFHNHRQTETIRIPDIAPEAMAFDAQGRMYILDEEKVAKLTPDHQVDYTFAPSEGIAGGFSRLPGDLEITPAGLVYLSDRRGHRVHVFNTDGIFIRTIENWEAQQPLDDPAAMAVDTAGRLYLLDAGRQAVAVFSTEGRRQSDFSVSAPGGRPLDLSVAAGKIYVLDQNRQEIRMYLPSGELVARFGSEGDGAGRLDEPLAMAAKEPARLWVSDPGNQRLQAFQVIYTPPPPRDFQATAGPRRVELKWSPAADPLVENYTVFRAKAPSARPQALGTTRAGHFSDPTVQPGRDYYYRVAARARNGHRSNLSPAIAAAAEKLSVGPPQNLSAKATDFTVTLTWQAPEDPAHLGQYIVYRNDREIARLQETCLTDTQLAPDTAYTYQVAAESTDEIVSSRVALPVHTRVTTRPPVEIEVVQLSDIFSNTYKNYEKNGIGQVAIRNNTKNIISKLKVLFTIKNFMDFPSESTIVDLAPGQTQTLTLKAVFNDKILNVTEDTPVQTEITASYYMAGQLKSFSAQKSINVYEKHKMKWDDHKRIGAFVTTKDEVVLDFVRSVITQYDYPASDPLISACIIFDALGTAGITYTQDPTNSYQETENDTELIDYLQYPRETIRRKSGDCDDLVILYTAALESIGLKTRFVEVPGHILMMFEVGSQRHLGTGTMNDMLVMEGASVWIPVEVTAVGKPFATAWELGSRNYYTTDPANRSTLDLHKAWEKYKPASLPATSYEPPTIAKEAIETRFDHEFREICQTSLKIKNRIFFERLRQDPQDTVAHLQLGIEYARFKLFDQALAHFDQALQNDPDNAAILNNTGNIAFLQEKYEQAIEAYQKAATAAPDDPMIRVNLAKAYLKINQDQTAKKAFQKACDIDPEIARSYRALALKLLGPS